MWIVHCRFALATIAKCGPWCRIRRISTARRFASRPMLQPSRYGRSGGPSRVGPRYSKCESHCRCHLPPNCSGRSKPAKAPCRAAMATKPKAGLLRCPTNVLRGRRPPRQAAIRLASRPGRVRGGGARSSPGPVCLWPFPICGPLPIGRQPPGNARRAKTLPHERHRRARANSYLVFPLSVVKTCTTLEKPADAKSFPSGS